MACMRCIAGIGRLTRANVQNQFLLPLVAHGATEGMMKLQSGTKNHPTTLHDSPSNRASILVNPCIQKMYWGDRLEISTILRCSNRLC